MEYSIFIIYDKTENDYDYFLTKNNLSKALYSLKNSKKETKIKTIINNNNYETRLIRQYEKMNRIKLINELKKIKSYHKENKNQIINFLNKEPLISSDIHKYNTLHHITKNSSLNYGKKREDAIYKLIVEHNIFNNNIYRANYIYSEFDLYSDEYYLFEIKSLTYSVNKYPTAIMNTSKLIYNNFIFIFEYIEPNGNKQLYFYKYDEERVYNTRFITPLNRINTVEIIDIPINELTKFYDNNEIIEFENPCSKIKDRINIDYFNYLLWKDEYRLLFSN